MTFPLNNAGSQAVLVVGAILAVGNMGLLVTVALVTVVHPLAFEMVTVYVPGSTAVRSSVEAPLLHIKIVPVVVRLTEPEKGAVQAVLFTVVVVAGNPPPTVTVTVEVVVHDPSVTVTV